MAKKICWVGRSVQTNRAAWKMKDSFPLSSRKIEKQNGNSFYHIEITGFSYRKPASECRLYCTQKYKLFK